MLIFTDPHGCFLTFKKLFDDVTSRFPGEPVAIAGDLPDRGPRTREMIQFVIDNKIPCVRGNHDEMMSIQSQHSWWVQNGGIAAAQSYCLHEGLWDRSHTCEGKATLEEHRKFLAELPYWLEYEDLKHENGRHLLITHAPIRNGHLENQVKRYVMDEHLFVWNRDRAPRSNVKKWFNVHGHTPCSGGPDITEWYANIDTGCAYAGRHAGYGKLTCLRFPQMEVYQQENIE